MSRRAFADAEADVIVIGAGLSGLRAAMDLEEIGLTVQVIEGRDRIGGRVFSLKNLPGAPEAGGNAFLRGYGRCLDVIERLKVPIFDSQPRIRKSPQEIYMGGKRLSVAEWAKSPLNILPDAYKNMPPFAVTGTLIAKTNPLKNPDDWYDPAFLKYDIPVHTLFKEQGFTDAQIDLAYNINAYYGTSSHDTSLLMAYFNDIWTRGMDPPVAHACVGGNYHLPEAMAASLKREVHLNKAVVGIRTEKERAEVVCADGSKYAAKHVVCTIPLAVLRYVHFDQPLPEHQTKALKTVPYQPMTQVHFTFKGKFWEEDGASPAMWTDSLFGTLVCNRFNKDDDEVTSLAAWARGFNAVRLDQYDPEDAKKLVVAEIEKLRPAAKGKLEAAYIKSWLRDPFAGGDWAIWAPGQLKELAPGISKPHGRIHFAGEHTSKSNRGMEGAMESGERAAQEIAQEQ